ncbi:hypothetical protein Hanom_Chr09g00832701 [Helianthus anomalus]
MSPMMEQRWWCCGSVEVLNLVRIEVHKSESEWLSCSMAAAVVVHAAKSAAD